MWLIFLITVIVVVLAMLFVVWIGSKIFRSIRKQDFISEMELNDLKRKYEEKVEKDN